MLQKLENAYLAILRFIVIAVAGILLVAVVILGFNSFKAIQFEPRAKEISPKVSVKELINGITEKPSAPQSELHGDAADEDKIDPNAVFYERTANAIVTFVAKYSGDAERVDKAQVIEIAKERAESFDDPKLVVAFAGGFAESLEKTLVDPSIIKMAKATSALDIVNKALNVFAEKFNEQIDNENQKFAAKQEEYITKKAEGVQSFYVAAGAFAAFLIIVFLSIIIRIERNLRHLENKSVITV